jgi:hypothetical protein
MKRLFLLLPSLLFLVFSCGTQSNQEECSSDECLKQQAYDKVIAVHDEVMPKLSYISELKSKLEEKMTTIEDSVEAQEYLEIMQDLDTADESMWVWMRSFNSDIEPMPIDEAMDYLNDEQAKIDQVAEKINTSIKTAEAAIAK